MNEISFEYTNDWVSKNGQVSENEHLPQKNTYLLSALYKSGINIEL